MEYRLISSLDKVFPDRQLSGVSAPLLTALQGETVSLQLAAKNAEGTAVLWPQAQSPLGERVHIRRVESVPVRMPRAEGAYDENYLSIQPGLYPDLLLELGDCPWILPQGQWRALWIEIDTAGLAPGEYPLALTLREEGGAAPIQAECAVRVLAAALPKEHLLHTEWFHADCLADYYQVPVWSEKHWEIVERFVRAAVRRGCTMLLTPHFTPALDTRVGGERTTVQLVEVAAEGDAYRFDFSRLKRWVDMALRCGVEQLEMSHLFTQWGAKAAPKVMALKEGRLIRLFGWDTPAVGGEYTRFLHAYLPQLIAQLRAWGVADRVYFHISDEPSEEQLESYQAAKRSVEGLLEGFPIMDALSDYSIFQQSGIQRPVVCVHHLQPFLDRQVSPLWGYYCCAPDKGATNRFLFMPLARARVIGVQFWKYRLQGFLHWGYNFYNTFHSLAHVDPHLDTEAGGVFPAGDSFVVYPGRDGAPEESMRLMVMQEAMQDYRALCLLEQRIGREKTLKVLEAEGEITLNRFPARSADFLRLRARMNAALEESV